MKRAWIVILISLAAMCQPLPLGAADAAETAPAEVVRVATALDHLTVLEFAESVTMAAAGSSSYQIEWKDNKVFIKPLQAGAQTDLFVWTATRRFNYELHTDEVKNMNFAIDTAKPASTATPTPAPQAGMDQIADMALTRAFLGSERVDSTYIKDRKGHVVVRVEHVFVSATTLYIHYSVRNLSDHPYRLLAADLRQLVPLEPRISLVSLRYRQLEEDFVKNLGAVQETSIALAHSETVKSDLSAGEETDGVIAVRRQFPDLTVFQMSFVPEGGHSVRAIFVR